MPGFIIFVYVRQFLWPVTQFSCPHEIIEIMLLVLAFLKFTYLFFIWSSLHIYMLCSQPVGTWYPRRTDEGIRSPRAELPRTEPVSLEEQPGFLIHSPAPSLFIAESLWAVNILY